MATDWNALAKLGAGAFAKKDTVAATVVRRKVPAVAQQPKPVAAPPEATEPLCWVMFPDDVLCPEWASLEAWARQAPARAFEIMPHRSKMYVSRETLRLAILDDLAAANGAVVVGLIYELRTLKARWERRQRCV